MADMQIGKRQVLFKGVKGYWNYLTSPNDDGKYSTQIVLTEKQVDELLEAGFNKDPKSIADKEKAAQRNAKKKGTEYREGYPDESQEDYVLNLATNAFINGKPVKLPVTMNGAVFEEAIGAGSTLDILCQRAMTSKGESLFLHKVDVKDLVPVAGGSDEFEIGGVAQLDDEFDDFGGDNPFG